MDNENKNQENPQEENPQEEIVQEENTEIEEIQKILDNGELFGSNLSSLEDDSKDSDKKQKKPFLDAKKKKILTISIASVSLVVVIFVIVFLIRIGSATRACKGLIAKDFYSESYLIEQMKSEGFNDFEIERAFANCKIDFNTNAVKKLNSLIENPTKIMSKDELKKQLNMSGYSDEEVENLFLSVNWDSLYKTYVANYLNSHSGVVKKNELLNELKNNNFPPGDISYISSLPEWTTAGQKYVKLYFDENPLATKNDVSDYLYSIGYTDEDVSEIFEATDWNKQALKCIENFLKEEESKSEENRKEITKELFETQLTAMGFSEDEIMYAIDNYNFSDILGTMLKELLTDAGSNVSKTNIGKALRDKHFTDEEINSVFATTNWNEFAYNTCLDYLNNNKSNKNAALQYLKDNGYSDSEINYVTEKLPWTSYAQKALLYLQEGNALSKQDVLNKLREFGYSEDDIMIAKNSMNFNTFALNYIKNTQAADKLSRLGKTDIKNILDGAGYTDEYAYVVSQFNWTGQALNYLRATLSPYMTSGNTYDYDKIVSEMQDKGFTANSDIYYAFNNYDFEVFAGKWAKTYMENHPLPRKNEYEAELKKMKINSKSDTLFTKDPDLTKHVDWKTAARDIASQKINDGKESVISMLEAWGYSDNEIEYAIQVFPPES